MHGFPNQRIPSALLLLLILQVIVFSPGWAQSRQPSTVIGPLTLGGNIGILTEAYRADGINDRRPAGSGRLYGNTTATMYGVRYNLDFLLSTEDDRIRQSQNRVSLGVQYKEWKGTLGYFSPNYNKYGLKGSTIRGATLDYSPGILLFSFIAGQSQRAVSPGIGSVIRRPSFRRNVLSTRVGIGQETKSHFFITGFLARDNESSLSSTSAVSPAENVLFTPQFGLHLLDNRLVLKGELTASAFSSDTRAARSDESTTPTLFGIFTPRIGSRFDYASSFSARYTHLDFAESLGTLLNRFTLLTSYDRVDPGFVSLGRPYTRSDQAMFRIQPQASMLNNKLLFSLDITSRRNNLNSSRNATLHRNQVNLTTQAQVTSGLFVNMAYQWLSNNNEPLLNDPSTLFLQQKIVTQSFLLAPVLTTQINGLTHRFSISTTLQSLNDRTNRDNEEAIPVVDFSNYSTTLSHAVILSSGLSLNSSLSRINSNSPNTDVKVTGIQVGLTYSFFDRKLSTGLSGSYSKTTLNFQPFDFEEEFSVEQEESTQWTSTLNCTYRVTTRNIVRFMIRGLSTTQPVRGNFSEVQSILRFEHRF